MTDLDMARIKSDAIEATYRAEPLADDVLALLDRIEALEADGEEWYTAMMRKAIDRAIDAEARLARVTDDSMAEQMLKPIHDAMFASDCPCDLRNDPETNASAQAALATIRAVAADEQETTGEFVAMSHESHGQCFCSEAHCAGGAGCNGECRAADDQERGTTT